MSTDTPKPLPCPFCGAAPTVIIRRMGWHDIICHGLWCAAVVRVGAATKEKAIADWNRRAPVTETKP